MNLRAVLCRSLLIVPLACAVGLRAQTAPPGDNAPVSAGDEPPPVTLSVHSTLVLVPALVRTKEGDVVFTLKADDFQLTDNGVPQKLRLEEDTDHQPLALVVVAQTGGVGAAHLEDYKGLGAVLDAMIGDVAHKVAIVSFDSKPILEEPFTSDTDKAAGVLGDLVAGDTGAATLDGVGYAVEMLRKQPPAYRRAILLLSETVDGGSKLPLGEALRVIGDTNTTMYTIGFNSTRAGIRHEASKLNSSEPGPVSGCMSKDPDADPDANGNRAVQALDCASELLRPLRLARMAYLAAKNGLRRNVPEEVAHLTGGEYYSFKNKKTLERDLMTISNHVPNRYILSFRPQSPHSGLHALELKLPDHPDLKVQSRSSYWVEPEPSASPAKP